VGGKADMVLVKGDAWELLVEETLYLPMCGVWRDGMALHVHEDVVN
jgi:hypothetical protein